MNSFLKTAIQGEVFIELERQFINLAFNEFIYNLEREDELRGVEWKEYEKKWPLLNDKHRERHFKKYLKIFKENIYEYINSFNDNSNFIYLSILVDLCEEYNPENRYEKLLTSFKMDKIERSPSYDEYFKVENPTMLDNRSNDLTKEMISAFDVNYKFYIKSYSIFTDFINKTYNDFRNGIITKNKKDIDEIVLDHNPVFNIVDSKELLKLKYSGRVFTEHDVYVTTLLFDYLRSSNVILNFNNESLSKVIGFLTATSDATLKRDVISYLSNAKKGQLHHLKNYKGQTETPLEKLKKLVSSLLNKINQDLEEVQIKK